MSIKSSKSSGERERAKWARIALTIGIIGLAIAAIGLLWGVAENNQRPVFSWLIGFTVWYSAAVGMLFFLMIFHVLDSGWAVIVRRQLEHAVSVFYWLALIFLPLLLIGWFADNSGVLWKWMDPFAIEPTTGNLVGEDPLYLEKKGYLNLTFFTLRVIFYFSIYCFWVKNLRYNSFKMDVSPNPKLVKRSRVFAAIGLPVMALVSTFAAFDFYMSLSYHWFSTMFGVWFFANSMRMGLAWLVLIVVLLGSKGYLKGILNRGHLYLLGCMALAFTVFWAYISFCQYFLIYNANIPEETFWYNIRELDAKGGKTSWWFLSIWALVFGYFVIPFLLLLYYKTKVIAKRLVLTSSWIIFFGILDVYFNILPVQKPAENIMGFVVQQFSVNLWDIAAILGVGGICVWAFIKSMAKAQPIPIHDPRIEESIHYHE